MTASERYELSKTALAEARDRLMDALKESSDAKSELMAELQGEVSGLTPRQQQIIVLVRKGLINKQIADRLSISTRTVKYHISGILQKYGVDSRRSLI